MNRMMLILRGIRFAFWLADEIELMQAKKAAQDARLQAQGQAAGAAAKKSSDATRTPKN